MPDRFNYVKRGYDPGEVDNYIETLENVIKSYKEKDAAIKNALINAQLAADNIVKNAEAEAGTSKARALSQLDRIKVSVSQQRTLVDSLRQDYSRVVDEYLKQVDERDFAPIYDQITKLEEFLDSLKQTPEPAGDSAPADPAVPQYTAGSPASTASVASPYNSDSSQAYVPAASNPFTGQLSALQPGLQQGSISYQYTPVTPV